MLGKREVISILKNTGVLLEGHFKLTSGKHSDKYLQCAKIFQYPEYSEKLCTVLADKFRFEDVEIVLAPAVGGIIIGYEVGRSLGVKNIFAERENGVMTLRRGFELKPGQKVLVVEDVITTGGSVKEVIELVKHNGAELIGVGTIIDRSNGEVDFDTRFESVIGFTAISYDADDCPMCEQNIPLVKPGSRHL